MKAISLFLLVPACVLGISLHQTGSGVYYPSGQPGDNQLRFTYSDVVSDVSVAAHADALIGVILSSRPPYNLPQTVSGLIGPLFATGYASIGAELVNVWASPPFESYRYSFGGGGGYIELSTGTRIDLQTYVVWDPPLTALYGDPPYQRIYQANFRIFSVVPEPATWITLPAAALGLLAYRRLAQRS